MGGRLTRACTSIGPGCDFVLCAALSFGTSSEQRSQGRGSDHSTIAACPCGATYGHCDVCAGTRCHGDVGIHTCSTCIIVVADCKQHFWCTRWWTPLTNEIPMPGQWFSCSSAPEGGCCTQCSARLSSSSTIRGHWSCCPTDLFCTT